MSLLRDTAKRWLWFSVLLSALFPSAGLIALGRTTTAVALAFSCLLSFLLSVWILFESQLNPLWGWALRILTPLFYLAGIILTFVIARRNRREAPLEHPNHRKDPYLAFLLSILWPGLGHAYLRQWIAAIAFILLSAYLVLDFLSLYMRMLLSISISVLSFYSAHRDAPTPWKLILPIAVYVFLFPPLIFEIDGYKSTRYGFTMGIEGYSMSPAVLPGDITAYRPQTDLLSRGSIVTFTRNATDPTSYIKRVVAFEGELVQIKDGTLIIDDSPILTHPFDRLSYEAESGRFACDEFGYRVPEGHVFVLGDNTTRSFDSRHFGAIPRNRIRGIAVRTIWPISRIQTLLSAPVR